MGFVEFGDGAGLFAEEPIKFRLKLLERVDQVQEPISLISQACIRTRRSFVLNAVHVGKPLLNCVESRNEHHLTLDNRKLARDKKSNFEKGNLCK